MRGKPSMPETPRRLGAVSAAVLLLLAGSTVANAAEFGFAEERVSTGWRAGPVANGGDVERSDFTVGRYGVYFALAEYAPGADFISSVPFKGNIKGRILGLARANSFTVLDYDPLAIAPQLDLSSHVVAQGSYADGRGSYVLAVLDEDVETIVHLEVDEFDWILVDRRLIPDALAEESGL
jgi:hypothetical protein